MKYCTIVADPPWPYPEGFAERADHPHKQDRDRGVIGTRIERRQLPYQPMSIPQIAALPIPTLAATDARLFLWTTMRYVHTAIGLLAMWGFAYKQMIVWDKRPNVNPLGGSVAPNSAEFLIVAVRGKPPRTGRWTESVISARKPRSEHSRKPDVFLDLVEEVSPAPYVELFARRDRLGWDTWGNQCLGTATMEAA